MHRDTQRDPAPGDAADWRFQHGLDPGNAASLADAVLDPRLLDHGRFLALPDGIDLPDAIYVARPNDAHATAPPMPLASPDALLDALGTGMSRQWRLLHERASGRTGSAINANTLRRYAYNTFAVRRLKRHLDEHGTSAARALLVTAYETPVQELLECERIREVLVVDISRHALETVWAKYAHHREAHKLALRILDFSGIDPVFQAREIDRLSASAGPDSRPPADTVVAHFAEIASGRHCVRLALESGAFDVVHVPFVLGSLYLGPVTAVKNASAAAAAAHPDYESFVGAAQLRSPEARRAAFAVMKHVMAETRRVLTPDGLIVINLWARPQPDAPHFVRMSDTPMSRAEFDDLMRGCERIFTGNPQPTLPHTVGHVFVCGSGL